MKIMHCEDNRAEQQRAFVQTIDGKFKYELFLDYAKGLPKELELVPVLGSVSGGCVDKDDNLYFGLRAGGGPVKAPNCLIKLDPDGNYVGTFGEGKLGHLHFFECTNHGTIVILQTNEHYALEMSLETGEVVRTFGEKGNASDCGRGQFCYEKYRLHNGIFPTEPFEGLNPVDGFALLMDHKNAHLAGPFNLPTDVDFDSQGNYYFSDGYANLAVHKFDQNGNLVKTWGGPGVYDGETDTPGKFLLVHSICVDARDHIWVCDREKDAVHVFDNQGNVLAYCSHNMGQPSGVDCDDEYVYVAGRGGYITIFDLDFNIVGQLGYFNGNLRAHHIAVDSKSNLYLFPTKSNYEHQVIALKRIQD